MHHLSFQKTTTGHTVYLDGKKIIDAPTIAPAETSAAELRVLVQDTHDGFLVGEEIFLLSPHDRVGVFFNNTEVATVPLSELVGAGAYTFTQLAKKSERFNEGFRDALDRLMQIAERAGIKVDAERVLEKIASEHADVSAFELQFETALLSYIPDEARMMRSRLQEAVQKLHIHGLFETRVLSGAQQLSARELLLRRAKLFEIYMGVKDGPAHEAVAAYPHRGELFAVMKHAPQFLSPETQAAVAEQMRAYEQQVAEMEMPGVPIEVAVAAERRHMAGIGTDVNAKREKKPDFNETVEVKMTRPK